MLKLPRIWELLRWSMCSLCLAWSPEAAAQSLEDHQWKDRVLVLVAENSTDVSYRRQLLAFRAEEEALTERIGVVYHIFPNTFGSGLDRLPIQERSPGPVRGMHPEKGFGLLLIGLDGRVKMRSETFVAPETIWALIDGMPMRRAETKNKGTNH